VSPFVTYLRSLLLYLVATPLGNLQDITLRALECLKTVDLILCEDTRHSQKLLNHYGIKKPLKSLHKFNEKKSTASLLTALQQGKSIALITDAGTPCIQDPGTFLVKACHEKELPVTSLPGPCAFVTTLSLSGEEEGPFQFVGFLPKKQKALTQGLLTLLEYEGHSLAYVSPHELVHVLKTLAELAPERTLLLTKELSKIHETLYQGPSQTLYERLKDSPPKGEFVLMIKKAPSTAPHPLLKLPIEEHVLFLEKTYHLSKKEAIKLAAQQRDLPKRILYNELMQKE